MKNNWLKRGLTFFLIAAVCCCFMPGLALAAEGTDAEQAAAAAKGAVSIQGVLAPAAKDAVVVQAAADKKDKSLLNIKTVNGSKEDVTVQVFLWKNDKSLTDGKKDNDKKEKAAEATVAGLDKKTGEATISGTKVKLTDGKDGRYLEYTVKAGKTVALKIKLEPVEAAKDKTVEVVAEVKIPEAKAAETAPAEAKTEVPAAAEDVTGTEANKNAAANDAQAKEEESKDAADGDKKDDPAEADKVEVSVTKVWSDEEDKDKIRPTNVTIKLLADGTDTGKTLILDANANWKGSFKDLDKQKDGKDIAYTVQEVEVKDYTAAVTGDAAAGFTVTNTHTPAAVDKVTVSGTVTWDDSDNKNKKRPTKVTVRLFANGEEMQLTRPTADTEWKYEFKDLDKVDSKGKDITYTVKQDAVTSYTTTYKGYDITNKYKTTSSSSTTKKSSSTTSKKTSKNAKTGDSTHLGLYLALMLIAAAGAVAMVLKRRRG
ncbi:MAG: Cna B-type domain-containing protein [Firmicutes bacterium]|nr:Cna B-type domain-containing protein [Bacillota bacterium]